MVGQRRKARKRGHSKPPRPGRSKFQLIGFAIFLLVDLVLIVYVIHNR